MLSETSVTFRDAWDGRTVRVIVGPVENHRGDGLRHENERPVYRVRVTERFDHESVDMGARTVYESTDLRGGTGDRFDPIRGLESFLGFLSAWFEALRYSESNYTAGESDNLDLFPRDLEDVLRPFEDEMDALGYDLTQAREALSRF